MDLSTLKDSLPPPTLAGTSLELTNAFKGAAASVTLFYKESLYQNKRAYAAGYEAALNDLAEFVTRRLSARTGPVSGNSVSVGASSSAGGGAWTAPRTGQADGQEILDYIEARQVAVRLEAADEGVEDEETVIGGSDGMQGRNKNATAGRASSAAAHPLQSNTTVLQSATPPPASVEVSNTSQSVHAPTSVPTAPPTMTTPRKRRHRTRLRGEESQDLTTPSRMGTSRASRRASSMVIENNDINTATASLKDPANLISFGPYESASSSTVMPHKKRKAAKYGTSPPSDDFSVSTWHGATDDFDLERARRGDRR